MAEIHKEWSMVIGRFQCIPPHEGHVKLIKNVLSEGKNVVVALREADGSDKNPYSNMDRYTAFMEIFKEDFLAGHFQIIFIPDVIEVVHGRKVGWSVREIKLDKEIEKISATEIRNRN